jgi:hypothetical protein
MLQDTSGRETSPAMRDFRPKFLDTSGLETLLALDISSLESPALRQVQTWDKSGP